MPFRKIFGNLLTQYGGMRRELYILFFGRMVTAMGSMAWPLLTMILSRKIMLNPSAVAGVMACASLVMIPANLLGGWLVDHFNKKNCIIVGDLISVTGYMICALTPLSMVSIVLIILSATCQNMENSAYGALVADLTKTKDRERAFSLEYLGCNLGFVFAPMMAGFLFANYLWLAFLISSVSIGITTILIFWFVRDLHPEKDDSQTSVYQNDRSGESVFRILMENRILMIYLLIIGLYWAAYAQYNYLMPLDLGRVHGDTGAVIFGSVTSVNAIIVVVFTPIFTSGLAKLTTLTKNLMGAFFMFSGYGLFCCFIGRIPMYYLVMGLFTFGEILVTITFGAYLNARIPASHRGRINGMVFVSQNLMQSICLQATGFIYEGAGRQTAWNFVLSICVVIIAGSIVLIPLDRRKYPALYK